MSETCRTSGSSCETENDRGGACAPSGGGRCPCGTPGCSGDPLDCAIGMWSCAFFRAMKAVQVDLLKARIQKAWGAKMEKAADAVLEAMGVQWQSMLAQAQAKAQFRQRLQSLWQEGNK